MIEESKTKLLKHIDDEKKANLIMSKVEEQMKKQYYMAHFSYQKLWRSEFYNNVSAKDGLQDINLDRSKLEKNDSYKKGEKVTTNIETSNDEDVINKVYLDKKLSKVESHL